MTPSPDPDPFVAFLSWWRLVHDTAPAGFDPATVVVATADALGQPSARVVLLRHAGPDGFVFYTNYTSRKGADLRENPRAALCAYWYWLRRQVRIEGRVERVSDSESDAYFAGRPRGSQIGAWASPQSAPLSSRLELDDRVAATEGRFAGGPVPRPGFWGGFRLVPDRLEFWEERDSRLHDRLVYSRVEGGWEAGRLAP